MSAPPHLAGPSGVTHGRANRWLLAPRARIIRDGREVTHLPRIVESQHHLTRGFEGDQLEAGRRFERLIRSLGESPFWLETLRQAGIGRGDLRELGDLKHLPTLDRPTLSARWADLAVVDPASTDLTVVLSSGSTGQPVRVVRDGYDNVHMWAVLRFWLERLKVKLPAHPRVVLLDSLPSGLEYSVRLPLLERGALHRISLVRPNAAARLRQVGACAIFTDPAGLHWLSGQRGLPPPLAVMTSAVQLSGELRARFEASMAAPLIDYYALTELGPVAWSCVARAGPFHALAPDVWLEEVDGELIVTRLRPSALPMVRYRTGDRGRLSFGTCPCGFRGQSIHQLRGRSACRFVSPVGHSVDAWQLAWIFKHHPLSSFCLTQTTVDHFVLETPEAAGPQAVLQLHEALRRLGWAAPRIRTIQRAPGAGSKPEPFRTRILSTGLGRAPEALPG